MNEQREQDHQYKLKSKKRKQQEQQGGAPHSNAAAAETREEAHARREARRARKAAKRQRKAEKRQQQQQQQHQEIMQQLGLEEQAQHIDQTEQKSKKRKLQQDQGSPAARRDPSATEAGLDGGAEEHAAGSTSDGQRLLRGLAAWSRCLLGDIFHASLIEEGVAKAREHPAVLHLVQRLDGQLHQQQETKQSRQPQQQRHSQEQQGQSGADAGGAGGPIGEQGQAEAADRDRSGDKAASTGNGAAAGASSRAGQPWTPEEDTKLLALVAAAKARGKRVDWAPIDLAMCRMPKDMSLPAYKRHSSVKRRYATLSWQAVNGAPEPTAPLQQRRYPTPMWRMVYECLQALPNAKGTVQDICTSLAASQYCNDLNWTTHHRWKDKPYWYMNATAALQQNSHFYAMAEKAQGKQVYAIDPNVPLEKPKRSSTKGQQGYTAMGRNSRNMN